MAHLSYRNWIFDRDVEATCKAYGGIDVGGAESRACYLCRNFLATRPDVFPGEFLDLFLQLGIDHRKEAESYQIVRLAPNLHLYGMWFHFVGQIIRQTAAPLTLNENITIDFMIRSDLAAKSFANLPFVQVEITLEAAWTLAQEKEPD